MSLLGHSMGGITSFMYTCLFPRGVDLLVCLDAMKPRSNRPGQLIDASRRNIEKFLYYDELNQGGTSPPRYTYAECVKKQHLGSSRSIDPRYCRHVLSRNTRRCEDGRPDEYRFTRDSRLKVGVLIGMQHEDILELARRVTCPLMMLKATGSSYFEDKRNLYAVVDVLRQKNGETFEYHHVEGTHHVHLNEPEKVAAYVNPFLAKYAYGDRSAPGQTVKCNKKLSR